MISFHPHFMNSRWLWCLTLFNPIYNTAFLLVPSPFSHRIGFVGKNYSETPKISGWWFEALWKIWKSVGIVIPNIWKVIKAMFQTTNQIWIGKFGTPDKPWKTMENPDFHCRFSQHFTNPLRTSGPFGGRTPPASPEPLASPASNRLRSCRNCGNFVGKMGVAWELP